MRWLMGGTKRDRHKMLSLPPMRGLDMQRCGAKDSPRPPSPLQKIDQSKLACATGAKLRRWSGVGPCRRKASMCSAVP